MSFIKVLQNIIIRSPKPPQYSDELMLQAKNSLNKSISDLETFSQKQLPQIQRERNELMASLEKLAQNACVQKK